MSDKPRWHYRFDTFEKTYNLLQEICAVPAQGEWEQIVKECMIHRFALCMEMSWKAVKDYMEYKDFVFPSVSPNVVLREAYAAKLISNGEDWFKALEDRNKMSHTYDFQRCNDVTERITKQHLRCFAELHETLSAEIAKDSQ